MIFYALPLSSYSAKVRIVLLSKNVSFHEIEPPEGYRSEAYRAIVPTGTMPAINDEGYILAESEAINEYLEECYPAPRMLPTPPRDRATSRFLSRFHDLHLDPSVRALFPLIEPSKRDPALLEARTADVRRRIDQLAKLSLLRPFLAGDFLGLADCGPAVTVPLAQLLLDAIGQPLELPPELVDWQIAVNADPAVVAALEPWRTATASWIAAQLAS